MNLYDDLNNVLDRKALIIMNYAQAKRISSLIAEYVDWTSLAVGDVLDLYVIQAQLEEFIREIEHERA